MSSNYIYIAILIASVATYASRLLGAISAHYVNEEGKLFKFISCISYGILAALISRIFIHPVGALEESSSFVRIFAAGLTIIVLFLSKKNILFSSLFGIVVFGILNFYIH